MIKNLFKNRGVAPQPLMTIDPNERIYAVGDVHGRADLLKRMLNQMTSQDGMATDDRTTRWIFLGDYIDRGDDSAAVLEILSTLNTEGRYNVDFLLGNHEDAMLSFIHDPIANPDWLRFGAVQTLASFGIDLSGPKPDQNELLEIQDALIIALEPYGAFLDSLIPVVQSGNVVFAHAGWRGVPVDTPEGRHDAIWGYREFLQDEPIAGFKVVHGHYDAAHPVCTTGRICVDTGAYYSGKLTAVCMDHSETFISVTSAGPVQKFVG